MKDGKVCEAGRDHVVAKGIRKLRGLCYKLAPCVFVEELGAVTVLVVMRGPKKDETKKKQKKHIDGRIETQALR